MRATFLLRTILQGGGENPPGTGKNANLTLYGTKVNFECWPNPPERYFDYSVPTDMISYYFTNNIARLFSVPFHLSQFLTKVIFSIPKYHRRNQRNYSLRFLIISLDATFACIHQGRRVEGTGNSAGLPAQTPRSPSIINL